MRETVIHNSNFNVNRLLQNSKIVLDASDSQDVENFRRIIEASLKLGLWNGIVGLS